MQKIHVKNETLTFWCIRKRRKLYQSDKEHSWKKQTLKLRLYSILKTDFFLTQEQTNNTYFIVHQFSHVMILHIFNIWDFKRILVLASLVTSYYTIYSIFKMLFIYIFIRGPVHD